MLNNLQTGIGYLPRNIAGVQLDENQYDDYQRIAGRYSKQLLDNLANNKSFLTYKPEDQLTVIGRTISSARKAAQNVMFNLHPEILQQANQQYRDDIVK